MLTAAASQTPPHDTLPRGEFGKRLNDWNYNYLCLLKVAQLLGRRVTAKDGGHALIDWMVNEGDFNAVALSPD
jgi:hypothetical protein